MEGPLSKWTNVMKGWQLRWFVLDDNTGLLSYYLSKEKMVRGARRGCVRLSEAIVGIDDEDQTLFSVTVDGKAFHLQARDTDERDLWVKYLEDTVARMSRTASSRMRWERGAPVPPMADYDRQLVESDAYLQLLIQQAHQLRERQLRAQSDSERQLLADICHTANAVMDSIKHCIVRLQIAKNELQPSIGVLSPSVLKKSDTPAITVQSDGDVLGAAGDKQRRPGSRRQVPAASAVAAGAVAAAAAGGGGGGQVAVCHQPSLSIESDKSGDECFGDGSELDAMVTAGVGTSLVRHYRHQHDVPETSYSSSEDEDWFDTEEAAAATGITVDSDTVSSTLQFSSTALATATTTPATATGHTNVSQQQQQQQQHLLPATATAAAAAAAAGATAAGTAAAAAAGGVFSWQEYDRAYEEAEDELGSLDGCSSVISHLLSQMRIGMDLTRVVLPTFILERRSLLEMYADFFAHSDLFARIPHCASPRARMVQVLKWYLSAFHAGRKSEVAKKPYNPIIGETFRCVFDLPADLRAGAAPHSPDTLPADAPSPPPPAAAAAAPPAAAAVGDGPVPWGQRDQVCFVAEQVSHHPPVSAFYAEHYAGRLSFCGHIWTKSKFLGLSIGVHNIGQGCVSVLDHGEEYILTFPSGYGRSILGVPWIELGGAVTITCASTGYAASVEFLTKPFYGGRKHRVAAEVTAPGARRPFLQVEGEWNGLMTAKWESGETEVFVDTHTAPLVAKQVRSVRQQDEFESRRLWKDVTYNLKYNHIEAATEAKCFLEQRQRDQAKQRAEAGTEWQTKLFHKTDENWIYDTPLQRRLADTSC